MPDQIAPSNKAIAFRGRAQREYARLPRALAGKGRISGRALKRFQKMAGHNPPRPAFSEQETLEAAKKGLAGALRKGLPSEAYRSGDYDATGTYRPFQPMRYVEAENAPADYSSGWRENVGKSDLPPYLAGRPLSSTTRQSLAEQAAILRERGGVDAPMLQGGAVGGVQQGNQGVGVVGGGRPVLMAPGQLSRPDWYRTQTPALPSELAGISPYHVLQAKLKPRRQ